MCGRLLEVHALESGREDGGVTSHVSRQLLTAAWGTLASVLCDPSKYWNVVGANLKGEPSESAPRAGIQSTASQGQ